MEPAKTDPRDRRDMPRWEMAEEALLQSDDRRHPCTVLDISASGVKLRHDTTLAIDEELSLRLHGILPLHLRIVRVQPDFVAATFVDGPHYLFR